MKTKRPSKITFFVVFLLILALTYTAFFGVSNYHGDIRNVIFKGAQDIRWGIDIRGGVEAVFAPDISDADITDSDMEAAQSIIETRMVNQNITDYEIYTDKENNQVIVRFPWAADDTEFDPAAAIAELGETAELSFCKGSNYDANNVIFTGEHVANAKAVYTQVNEYGSPEWVVSLELDSEGATAFATATAELAQKGSIAICMDGAVISAPAVNDAITNGQAIITGMGSAEAAEDLANKINAGSLPFALSVDDSKLSIVSATLGTNALNVMVIAGAIAFGVVCLLMIIRYRLPGVVASIALLGQLAGSIAAISGFFKGIDSFTLTIPGIAGIILSIGVGVDCNVIAAERIRDEFKNGRTIDGAINSGFKNSLSAIIDGNVTIIIVAVVLMGAFGTDGFLVTKVINKLFSLIFGASIAGSIYSFGYTLLIGVIFNLIMGVVCSKWMLKSLSQLKFLRKSWLYGASKDLEKAELKAKKFNFDFNKLFKPVLIVFVAFLVVGTVISAIFGINLGIDFKGGTVITYDYSYDEAASISDINIEEVKTLAQDTLGVSATVTKGSSIATNSNTLTVSLVKNKSIATESFEKLTSALEEKYPKNNISLYNSNSVDASLATGFFLKSLAAVLLTAILVVVYVGFRFRKIGGITAALTALVALVLDILVSFIACAAFGLPIDNNYIAVVLTILGYSLNDTIVVYDSVREYKKLYPDKPLGDMVNLSLNRVKVRNIVTTTTTVLAVCTIIVVAEIYGLTTLRTFAIPMVFGLVSGCVSSLFISTPLWVLWRKKLDK